MSDHSIATETVTYPGQEGPIRAYVARPETAGRHPAILIGMEAFGWADHILDLTRRFAQAGYVTVMPDLYSNDADRAALTVADIEAVLPLARLPGDEAEQQIAQRPADQQPTLLRALAWRRKTAGVTTYVPDLAAGLNYVKGRADVDPSKVALIGYCMGGWLVGELLASGADVAAGIIYYGRLPDGSRAGAIKAPMQGHVGELDQMVNGTLPGFQSGMQAAGKSFDPTIYPGAQHAFFNDTRHSYHPEAARQAWDKTLAFLRQHAG